VTSPELAGILRQGLPAEPVFGAVAAIWRDGELLDSAVAGSRLAYVLEDGAPRLLPDEERLPMREDTLVDLASLSKLFTATLVLALRDDGLLDLGQPVAELVPEFAPADATAERRALTIRDLLVHATGLREDLPLWGLAPELRLATIAALPLEHPLGVFSYSCLGYVLAGVAAERAAGRPLRELMRDRLLDPLGLADTGYGPRDPERAAATEHQPWTGRGILRGEVHDEVAWALGGAAGNAGMFGTLAELGRFARLFHEDGLVDGRRVLAAGTAGEMARVQLPRSGRADFDQGLGFRIAAPEFMGALAARGAIGHTGFTGTSLVLDPARGVTAVLLSNRVHPSRELAEVSALRRAVGDAAAAL